MIKQLREDLDYILGTPPEDFDVNEVREALILLGDAIDDFGYQLDVPREHFQGQDYDSWKMKASYKLNKVKSARRRFSSYYNRIKEDTELTLLKSLCVSYINGNAGALLQIQNMVM